MKKILVYGFYFKGNLGDDLFVDAFKALFPAFNFTFVDQISISDLQDVDAVFIGGGSFLGDPINIADDATWDALLHHKIFYLGVGAETEIDGSHLTLMNIAKLIAIRSPSALDKVKEINPNTIVIPDLVYYLIPTISNYKITNSVLVIPNINVVPSWDEPHWKHTAWNYFKTEFAQFLDEFIIQEKIYLSFLPICNNFELNDSLACTEIIGHMHYRNNQYLLEKPNTLQSATQLISRYSVVITQRYHGAVLADMCQVPCLTIHHHDKLKNNCGTSLSYYGLTKDMLIRQFDQTKKTKVADCLPIYRDMFISLQEAVRDALCDH